MDRDVSHYSLNLQRTRMDERRFPNRKIGIHGNELCSAPSILPPLLFGEEARHLVYVFCEGGERSRKSKKHGYRRKYCSLCRHFHEAPSFKDGIEKYFSCRESPQIFQRGEKLLNKGDLSSDGDISRLEEIGTPVAEEENLKTLSIEGLKMYKKRSKTSHQSGLRKSEREQGGASLNRETDRKYTSARSGCKVCAERTGNENEKNKSKKKMIKIVLPSFE